MFSQGLLTMPRQPQVTDASDSPQGVALAASAFLIWGLSPIYWKALAGVPAFEILMHRMIWSFVFLAPSPVSGAFERLAWCTDIRPYTADFVVHHPDRGGQLVLVHLGHQQRPYSADQPGVLHQPARQRAAGCCFSQGTPPSAAARGRGVWRRWAYSI